MNDLNSEEIQNGKQEVEKLIYLAKKNQFTEVIQTLYHQEDLPLLEVVDRNNNSLLHFVCFHNEEETFEIIMGQIKHMKNNGQITEEQIREHLLSKNEDDYSPFHLAVYKGNLKMIEEMMKYNIDIFSSARKGLTVLHLASQGNYPHVIHYFLQKGVPVDIKNQNGGTALHYASFSQSAECVMFLLSQGSDVNMRDNQGVTPIYLAALIKDNTYIANKLLKRGANPQIKNNQGLDAVAAAKSKDNIEMVKLLNKKDGLIELMNIRQSQKPVTCKYLPLMLFFFLFFFVSLSTILFTIPYVQNIGWIIVLSILMVISFISFLFSWLVNPGYIVAPKSFNNLEYQLKCLQQNNDDHDICYDCIILRPARSKHCEYCKRCVQVYDHHCPWINNCVGAQNFFYFQIFIISAFFYSIFTVILSGTHMMTTEYGDYGPQLNNEKVQLLLHKMSSVWCIIFGILSSLMLLMLIKVQCGNIRHGKTTHERFNGVYQNKKLRNKVQNNQDEISNTSENQQSTEDEDESGMKKNLIIKAQSTESEVEYAQLEPDTQQPSLSCMQGAKSLCFENKYNINYIDYSF